MYLVDFSSLSGLRILSFCVVLYSLRIDDSGHTQQLDAVIKNTSITDKSTTITSSSITDNRSIYHTINDNQ